MACKEGSAPGPGCKLHHMVCSAQVVHTCCPHENGIIISACVAGCNGFPY
jgi:hypothetical protein